MNTHLTIVELKDVSARNASFAGLEARPGSEDAGGGREERHEKGGANHGFDQRFPLARSMSIGLEKKGKRRRERKRCSV